MPSDQPTADNRSCMNWLHRCGLGPSKKRTDRTSQILPNRSLHLFCHCPGRTDRYAVSAVQAPVLIDDRRCPRQINTILRAHRKTFPASIASAADLISTGFRRCFSNGKGSSCHMSRIADIKEISLSRTDPEYFES